MNQAEEFIKLLIPGLKEVVKERIAHPQLDIMRTKIFGKASSDRAFEEYLNISALKDAYPWTGGFRTQKQTPGYTSKVIFQRFANQLEIDIQLIEDELYGAMMDQAEVLADSLEQAKEKRAVNIFANAISAAFDFQESEEGLSWANAAHTTKEPDVSTASGFSNLGTSALDPVSLAAAYISLKRFRNSIGNVIAMNDSIALVHPITLSDTVEEIIGTDRGLFTNEGTINVHQGRYSSLPYNLLEDTTTTSWGLVKVNQMHRDLLWFDRIGDNYMVHEDRQTLGVIHNIHARFGYLFKDWRWGFWNNVV